MKLAKLKLGDGTIALGSVEETEVRLFPADASTGPRSLSEILHAADPLAVANQLVAASTVSVPLTDVTFLAPVDEQDVWAAGVTYKRSQVARMEESESAASHYDKVYSADRPELFFKSTPKRVVSPGEDVRVRYDSNWSVPEPEFTIVLNPKMEIVGYTIGNDMSARDIEGENPLYLPEAKCYRQSCSIGPCILLAEGELSYESVHIAMTIERGGSAVFQGETKLSQLARKLTELAGWLGRESVFPAGAMLLTGTGIVPDDDFSLEDGDVVSIEVSGIGTLSNPVVKAPA